MYYSIACCNNNLHLCYDWQEASWMFAYTCTHEQSIGTSRFQTETLHLLVPNFDSWLSPNPNCDDSMLLASFQ